MTDTANDIGRAHPISRAVSRFSDELKTLRDQPVWSMDQAETRDTMVEITFAEAQLAELKARVTAHGQASEVEADSGATSTANWLAHATRQTRPGAHRAARFATALATEVHEPVRIALADGRLLVDQAEVIIAAIDALPAELEPEIVADAQCRLIGYAAVHDAKALRILGKRILDVVAPEVGEAHEAKVLEREERDAEAAATFRMFEDGHGKWHGRFTLPGLHGAMLKKSLMAIAAPKHRAAVDGYVPEPSAAHRPQARPGFHGVRGRVTRPTGSPTPAACPPRWSCSWTTRPCSASSRPPSSTPGTGSHRPWPGNSRARPGSSPPSSVRNLKCSTSAGRPGSTPTRNGSR